MSRRCLGVRAPCLQRARSLASCVCTTAKGTTVAHLARRRHVFAPLAVRTWRSGATCTTSDVGDTSHDCRDCGRGVKAHARGSAGTAYLNMYLEYVFAKTALRYCTFLYYM